MSQYFNLSSMPAGAKIPAIDDVPQEVGKEDAKHLEVIFKGLIYGLNNILG